MDILVQLNETLEDGWQLTAPAADTPKPTTDQLALGVLERLIAAPTPEEIWQRMLRQENIRGAEQLLENPAFRRQAGGQIDNTFHLELRQVRQRLAARRRVENLIQRCQVSSTRSDVTKSADQEAGGVPIWPYRDAPEVVFRWFLDPEAARPVGFQPRWGVQSGDVRALELLNALAAIGARTTLTSIEADEIAAKLASFLGCPQDSPLVRESATDGAFAYYLPDFHVFEIPALSSQAQPSGMLLVIVSGQMPLRSPFDGSKLADTSYLFFDPLQSQRHKPEYALWLKLELLFSLVHSPAARMTQLKSELGRQLSLSEVFPPFSLDAAFARSPADSSQALAGLRTELSDLFAALHVALQSAVVLDLILFFSGGIVPMMNVITSALLRNLEQARGRRYGPLGLEDVKQAWGDDAVRGQLRQCLDRWLDMKGVDREILDIFLEDAATRDLSGGFPTLTEDQIAENLEDAPLPSAEGSVEAELGRLVDANLVVIRQQGPSRYALRDEGPTWLLLDDLLVNVNPWQGWENGPK